MTENREKRIPMTVSDSVPDFIVTVTDDTLDFHADIEAAYRPITGGNSDIVHIDTTANWNVQRMLVAKRGHIYVYSDHGTINGMTVPGMKIGDGTSYLIDMPFVADSGLGFQDHINNLGIHVTEAEKAFWNDKVTCFLSSGSDETIVFTKE